MHFTIDKINSFDPGYKLSEEEFDALNKDRIVKVNLPDTKESAKSGNGEGCFAILSESDYMDYTTNKKLGEFKAILVNSSIYYPIDFGTVVPCKHNGINRPIVDFDWLQSID